IVLASAVGVLLATILVDYVLKLPVVPRMMVLGIAVAAVFYLAFRWIVRPARARFTLSDVAGHLEAVFPQFDDRLRSTVDFVQQPAASIPGSEFMKGEVVSQATTMAQSVNLSQAII